MKIIAALGAMLLTATAANAYEDSARFVSKGGYNVHVSYEGNRMVLTGRHPVTGVTFDLLVTPQGVTTGTWNGKPFHRVIALDGQRKPTAGEQLASSAQ